MIELFFKINKIKCVGIDLVCIFEKQITTKTNHMNTQEIKNILKENGAVNVKVRKVETMGNFKHGIFNWNFDQISKEKLLELFPGICISALGQAWL